ncbi:histone-like nucleoid-structuring protein Lsr2 [Aeromicrobium sp. 179-A 4D2 NHS]|uniref:histone-like nucleoid-structuring protein Lsr2 n=1 Tax=Aeromicrobium sp. 179-A 4D2 NHS TaxID=3142375 RepID=UPI00399FD13D
MGIQTKTITEITDDFDGEPLPEGTQPFRLAYDGKEWDVYLSDKNADTLRKTLAEYTDNATRVYRTSRRTGGGSGPSARKGTEDLAAIREWARKNGLEVSERGRVAQDVKDAYYAAQ